MKPNNDKEKRDHRLVLIVFAVIFLVIVINMVVHIVRTGKFTNQERTVSQLSTTSDILVSIAPRGLSSDSWAKTDAFPDRKLYAQVYNAKIDNYGNAPVVDWTLRIDILEDCFINSAWNGTVEIHQFENGEEHVQEIYFLDYSKSSVELDYILGGQDVLITLSKGDYIIYHPDTSDSSTEKTIAAANHDEPGEAIAGMIFYTYDGNLELSSYELDYHLYKSLWSGTEFYIFVILLPLWFAAFVTYMISHHFISKNHRVAVVEGGIAEAALNLLAGIQEEKTYSFVGNSRRVAEWSRKLAVRMGMNNVESKAVYYCALVHDIGNIKVPEYLLNKSTKLTDEEYDTVKRHTVLGADMLEGFDKTPNMANGAKYHHERYDGTGYPEGKKGEEIPFIGRILCVVDAYVAMTSGRPYRSPMSDDEAIAELVKNSGTQFDPMIAQAMVETIRANKED